jgi:hypothetical protein
MQPSPPRRHVVPLALLAWICVLASREPARAAPPPPPAFDPTRVWLAYADEDWWVWVESTLIESTRHHRAQSHERTYRLQRVGEAATRAVLRHRGTRGPRVLTVLPDGTLGVYESSQLAWVRPAGNEPIDYRSDTTPIDLIFEGNRYRPLRGDARGLCLQEYALNEERPVLFVPLEGRKLRWARRRKLVGAVRVNDPPPCHFDDRHVACGGNVLDLVTGRVTKVDPPRFTHARALGSGWVAGFHQVLRIDGGAPERDLPHGHQAFAIRGGLLYAALPDSGTGDGPGQVTVFVSDPEAGGPPRAIAELHAEGIPSPYALLDRRQIVRFGPVHLVWGREGLWLFDGKAWRHQAWLEALPN